MPTPNTPQRALCFTYLILGFLFTMALLVVAVSMEGMRHGLPLGEGSPSYRRYCFQYYTPPAFFGTMLVVSFFRVPRFVVIIILMLSVVPLVAGLAKTLDDQPEGYEVLFMMGIPILLAGAATWVLHQPRQPNGGAKFENTAR